MARKPISDESVESLHHKHNSTGIINRDLWMWKQKMNKKKNVRKVNCPIEQLHLYSEDDSSHHNVLHAFLPFLKGKKKCQNQDKEKPFLSSIAPRTVFDGETEKKKAITFYLVVTARRRQCGAVTYGDIHNKTMERSGGIPTLKGDISIRMWRHQVDTSHYDQKCHVSPLKTDCGKPRNCPWIWRPRGRFAYENKNRNTSPGRATNTAKLAALRRF